MTQSEYKRVLQHRHYEALAKAVAAWGKERIPSDQYFTDFVHDLCNVLEKTNPEFSPARFVDACMVGRQ
jgi:hypothetical protein